MHGSRGRGHPDRCRSCGRGEASGDHGLRPLGPKATVPLWQMDFAWENQCLGMGGSGEPLSLRTSSVHEEGSLVKEGWGRGGHRWGGLLSRPGMAATPGVTAHTGGRAGVRQNREHSAGWPGVADGSAEPWGQSDGRDCHGRRPGSRRHCRQGCGRGPRASGQGLWCGEGVGVPRPGSEAGGEGEVGGRAETAAGSVPGEAVGTVGHRRAQRQPRHVGHGHGVPCGRHRT